MIEVTVILPFFNAEATLLLDINSIRGQSYSNFECLLIDNNSTDYSRSIAEKVCLEDSRFRLLEESRQGVVYAHNKGLSAASGGYVARMDADDISDPQRLQKQFEFLESEADFDLVSGKAKYVPHRSQTAGFHRYVEWSNSLLDSERIAVRRFVESPIINPTVMCRKSAFDRFGSYKAGDFPEDYELWLRWLEHGVKFHKLDDILIDWHDSDGRLTRTNSEYSDEAFFRIKTKYLANWLKVHNSFHPNVLVWGASKISRKRAAQIEDYGIAINAYIDISEKRILNKEIIHYTNLPSPDKAFVLVYLKEQSMRRKTQQFLEIKGYVEGKNYLLVS